VVADIVNVVQFKQVKKVNGQCGFFFNRTVVHGKFPPWRLAQGGGRFFILPRPDKPKFSFHRSSPPSALAFS
jgi:hypothetical protein